MKIRLDYVILIVLVLIANVFYFSSPPEKVWERNGVYYDPETGKKIQDINPENLVLEGSVVNGVEYKVYRNVRPATYFAYYLVIFAIVLFLAVHIYLRIQGSEIPILYNIFKHAS